MVSTGTFDTEVGGVVVAIFVVLVFVYMLYRYLRRRGPELAARESKSLVDDRAYNQIQLGRAAAERLAATGVDVSQARQLLDRAETARTGGNSTMSIELSKKAQDMLAAARSGGNGFSGSRPPAPGASAAYSGPPLPSSPAPKAAASMYSEPPTTPFVAEGAGSIGNASGSLESASNRPPKNMMEAHFQLSLALDELDQARGTRSSSSGFREAEALRSRGQAAYDRQDYTEALRLALRSRRALGTRIEGLPISPSPSPPGPGSSVGSVSGVRPPTSVSDPSASGQTCARCGRTVSPTDQFCRACGASVPPTVCANCGSPLTAEDRFCGRCGTTRT